MCIRDRCCTYHGDDRRKAGKESCKQNVRYIKEPVTDHGYSTLYDCQQRNTDGIGVYNHLDVVHYMLCIGFAERKYFADVFLHPLSAYQHKVKYEYQNEKVDCKATDAAHDELPYGRKCGDNKGSGILAPVSYTHLDVYKRQGYVSYSNGV